jgi:hypothetical protein
MSENEVTTGAAQGGNTEASTTSSGGRGGRGRWQTNRGGRGNRSSTKARGVGAVFKGNTEGMNGNVFQCYGESTGKQQFLKTVGVLGEHITKTFTYPQDVASVRKSFKIMPLVQPAELSDDDYKKMGKKMIWEASMKTYRKRVVFLEGNTRAIYAIVWGHCSPMMQSKLESLENYEEKKSDKCDCIWLIQEIQGIPHRFEGTRNVFISKVPSSRHQGGRREHTSADEVSGLSFLQNSATVPGTNGVTHHASIKCYNCQGQGHYASVCPVEAEVTMVQVETPTHEEAMEEPYLSEFTNSSSKTKDAYLFLHTVAGNKASHTLSAKLKERIKQGIYTKKSGIHLSKSSTKFCRFFFCVTAQ